MFNGIIFNKGIIKKIFKRPKGLNIFIKSDIKVSKKDIGFNKDYNEVSIIEANGKISKIKKNKKSFIASVISGKIINSLLINDKNLN